MKGYMEKWWCALSWCPTNRDLRSDGKRQTPYNKENNMSATTLAHGLSGPPF